MAIYPLFKQIFFHFEPETAHRMAVSAAKLGQLMPIWDQALFSYEDERLTQDLFGQHFRNPVGLAAGFDKNAELTAFWPRLGFGFAEIGSVTAQPSAGNPRPRVFRLPEDEALINRMGLNNHGAPTIAKRLAARNPSAFPIGVNLAKTHDPSILGDAALEDFAMSFRACAPYAAYVVLNISCPNTAEGKTFEETDALDALLARTFQIRTAVRSDVPVLVKLSPPQDAILSDKALWEERISVLRRHPIAGLIATNTASDREGLRSHKAKVLAIGRGGLSGKPLSERATALIRWLYQTTEGQWPIIGVGGVDSPESAWMKITAGASLIGVYTGLVYQGPGLIKRIKQGLIEKLDAHGLAHIRDAIGRNA